MRSSEGVLNLKQLPKCGNLRKRQDSRNTSLGLSNGSAFLTLKKFKSNFGWGALKIPAAPRLFQLCHVTSKFHLLMEARFRTSLCCSAATALPSSPCRLLRLFYCAPGVIVPRRYPSLRPPVFRRTIKLSSPVPFLGVKKFTFLLCFSVNPTYWAFGRASGGKYDSSRCQRIVLINY